MFGVPDGISQGIPNTPATHVADPFVVDQKTTHLLSLLVLTMTSTPARRRAVLRDVAFVLLGAVAIASLFGCSAAPTQVQGLQRTEPLDVAEITLPDVTRGRSVEGDELAMRAPTNDFIAVYFGYTACPDLCPATLAAWKAATNRLSDTERDRLTFVFITIDPERDSAQVLNDYVGSFVERYHVLRTTDAIQLQRAMDAFLAAANVRTVDGRIEVEHTTVTYLVNSNGQVVVEWPFGTTADALENDLKISLAIADDETTGEQHEAIE